MFNSGSGDSVTWSRFSQPRRDQGRLAMRRGSRRARLLEREPLNELLECGGHSPFPLTGACLVAQPRQAELAVVLRPAADGALAQMILFSNSGERDTVLQAWLDDMEPAEREVALFLREAA